VEGKREVARMSEAGEILAAARRRGAVKRAARVRTDYDALNRMVRRQRAALTRAKNSGDPEKVVVVVAEAVREWNRPGMIWPDDWPTWRCALWDATGDHSLELEDLG
jgi:hypothetical protein